MSESYRIVEVSTQPELEDARALFRAYAEDLGWDLSSGSIAQELAELPGSYAPPRGALLVAYVGEVAAGVLGLRPVPKEAQVPGIGAETFGELKRLFVQPGYRRLGIARGLMLRAEDEGRQRGYSALVLTTSAEWMPLAQPLYDALGYVEMEPYRNDMDFPNIRWMRKDL